MMLQKEAGLPVPVWQKEGVTWFLLCLIVWRTTLPVFARLHRPITVSLFLCVISCFLDEGSNFMPVHPHPTVQCCAVLLWLKVCPSRSSDSTLFFFSATATRARTSGRSTLTATGCAHSITPAAPWRDLCLCWVVRDVWGLWCSEVGHTVHRSSSAWAG